MTGGLMQLVAYGAQDIYLTGSPMITYFKVIYRRHTNFAMESIEQTFSGTVGFGNKVTALISRNGDLVSGLTLEVDLPAAGAAEAYTNDIGHHLIEECTVDIGGQQIDKHYGDWLEIWAQLTVPASQKVGYRDLIGQSPRKADGSPTGLQLINSAVTRRIYVPLQFWFCRNVGLALPLIALQYHEVKVSIKFRPGNQVCVDVNAAPTAGAAPVGNITASLWADYIYLDTDERRRFAQVSHEYLIEQLQLNEKSFSATGNTSVDLTFNHPVKELVWVCRSAANTTGNHFSNYTTAAAAIAAVTDNPINVAARDGNSDLQNMTNPTPGVEINPITTAQLKLNGHDRMAARRGKYFNKHEPLKRHTSSPDSPGICVYSFALKPEDHQPSGTCNFSRIDNAQLILNINTITSGVVKVFAVNYNVLRVMSGMGGLAYSN